MGYIDSTSRQNDLGCRGISDQAFVLPSFEDGCMWFMVSAAWSTQYIIAAKCGRATLQVSDPNSTTRMVPNDGFANQKHVFSGAKVLVGPHCDGF